MFPLQITFHPLLCSLSVYSTLPSYRIWLTLDVDVAALDADVVETVAGVVVAVVGGAARTRRRSGTCLATKVLAPLN